MKRTCANQWPQPCGRLNSGDWIRVLVGERSFDFCSGHCLRFWVRLTFLPGDDLQIVDGQVVLGADMRGTNNCLTASA